ncbi:MAG: Asp-tRNA(Asn)/Glu-tRNA(Gln) amidotransferase subunit GatB [Archangiaceae bacterium]|nr:Asp-tRNA(Asn)/Glu-tRNA(Gln) amidotransferase subunit GatB [Archangiaceae bacterium]
MSLADFQVVVGLEVHAQLLTQTKIFSPVSTTFGAEPNASTHPVCLGMPGTLPVLNEAVVELAVRAGLALGCEIRARSVWSRKHYFYPDSPKGYQITQYDQPICEHGRVGEVRIRRIHMEEDAGKSVHDADGTRSLVDLNRAGTPLLEIVSEPDLRSADDAVEYLKALREILMAVGVNDGNLEEGSFRCDANVSVMKKGASELGTRCELKNLNSFRFIKQAIEVEAARQVELLEGGKAVVQETRLFDPDRGETRAMRSKEDAHDYRYFPDPDLPPVVVSPSLLERVRSALPELPAAKRERYAAELKLSPYDAGLLSGAWSQLFEATLKAYGGEAKKVANWIIGEVSRLQNEVSEPSKLTPELLAALLKAVDAGRISANAGKDVLGEVYRSGRGVDEVIAAKGLEQVSDVAAIEAAVDAVIAQSPSEAASFKAGKTALLGFFVGKVMKAMKGKANPKVVNELVAKKLG